VSEKVVDVDDRLSCCRGSEVGMSLSGPSPCLFGYFPGEEVVEVPDPVFRCRCSEVGRSFSGSSTGASRVLLSWKGIDVDDRIVRRRGAEEGGSARSLYGPGTCVFQSSPGESVVDLLF